MITDYNIRSLFDGKSVDLGEYIKNKKDVSYHVGCDSLNIKDKTVFVVTLVGVSPNNTGSFCLYHREKVDKVENNIERLWSEVERSTKFATLLKDININVECIDFDLNPNEDYISSRLVGSAIAYAESLGFKGTCKPNSIHAIYAADFIVNKGSFNMKRNGRNL